MPQPRSAMPKPTLAVPVDPLETKASIDATNPADKQGASQLPDVDYIVIKIPIVRSVQKVDFSTHVDARLTPQQSHGSRMVAAALDRQQARLRDGKRVVSPTGAMKYILELISEAVEQRHNGDFAPSQSSADNTDTV